jgi:TetR/AcrR family transcriptional regulator, repressor for uid operon
MKRKTARFSPRSTMEERRMQILLDAAGCFSLYGFHATSMREICKAAKLSAGAMYHYFASKDEIIAAMIMADRQRTRAVFAQVGKEQGIMATLKLLTQMAYEESEAHGFMSMWAEILAEAARNDLLRPVYTEYYTEVHGKLTQLLKAAAKEGETDCPLKPADTAAFIMAVYDGVICRCATDKSVSFMKLAEQALKHISLMLGAKAQPNRKKP